MATSRCSGTAPLPLKKAKIYGLLGRNGAGKTTLFNCLTDEVPADGGRALLFDSDGAPRPLTPDQVGYVYSTPILPDFLTGYDSYVFLWIFMKEMSLWERQLMTIFDMVKIDAHDRHQADQGVFPRNENKVADDSCSS